MRRSIILIAIVTILSPPTMLGCTIALGGRGMSESEESCGRRSGGERIREGRKGRQVVPHGVPRHPTMRGCGPPRVERERECEARRGASGTKRKEVVDGVVGGEGIYVTRTRTSWRGKEKEVEKEREREQRARVERRTARDEQHR